MLPTGPAAPCPPGFLEPLGRSGAVLARLRATDEGARWLGELGQTEIRLCFGAVDVPVVSEDRVLMLDARADDVETAARVGHLVAHVVRGMPFPAEVLPDADCDAVVERALAAEAQAYGLELRLRRALGLSEPRYEFEPAFHAGGGEATILGYLREHPEGGPNVDGLATAYRERCEVERAEAARPRRGA